MELSILPAYSCFSVSVKELKTIRYWVSVLQQMNKSLHHYDFCNKYIIKLQLVEEGGGITISLVLVAEYFAKHYVHIAYDTLMFWQYVFWNYFQGLYYSFYKKLVGEPSFFEALNQLTNDSVTEYGHTINTLKRFNLYPEVSLVLLIL